MSRELMQQLVVFAAIFLCFQLGFDLLQGQAITPGIFLSRLVTTIIATVIYGALTVWLKKRKERGE